MAANTLLQNGSGQPLTLRAVAREAGINANSIYRHFPDVDAILRAVVVATFTELEDAVKTARSGVGAVEGLVGVCRTYLGFAAEHPERFHLLFGGVWVAADAPGADATELADRADVGMSAFAVLVEALEACITEGTSTSSDAVADASKLWAAMHGLAVLRKGASLFVWPQDVEAELLVSLARLTVRPVW